jgi:hypothetical protein
MTYTPDQPCHSHVQGITHSPPTSASSLLRRGKRRRVKTCLPTKSWRQHFVLSPSAAQRLHVHTTHNRTYITQSPNTALNQTHSLACTTPTMPDQDRDHVRAPPRTLDKSEHYVMVKDPIRDDYVMIYHDEAFGMTTTGQGFEKVDSSGRSEQCKCLQTCQQTVTKHPADTLQP